jgi:phage pi2 protein 07
MKSIFIHFSKKKQLMILTKEDKMLIHNLVYDALVNQELVACNALEDWVREKISQDGMIMNLNPYHNSYQGNTVEGWIKFIYEDSQRENYENWTPKYASVIRKGWSKIYEKGLIERLEKVT